MSVFPTTPIDIERINNSSDAVKSARLVLKDMTEKIQAIIDCYNQGGGLCGLDANGRIPSASLKQVIDTAQMALLITEARHFQNGSVKSKHIQDDAIVYTQASTTGSNYQIDYLSLDGVNDYVDAPHVNFENNKIIDFKLNFKLRQSSSEREWLVNQAGSFEIDIRANATDEFYLILARGSSNGTNTAYNKKLEFENSFTDNEWHTLHITVDPTTTVNNITASIDGISTTSTSNLSYDFSGDTFEDSKQSTYNFLIGNARAYSSPYSGSEVLYPDSTPTDTLDLDLNYAILKVADTTAFSYLFNTGSGTTVTDTAGSNDATIINNTSPNWSTETGSNYLVETDVNNFVTGVDNFVDENNYSRVLPNSASAKSYVDSNITPVLSSQTATSTNFIDAETGINISSAEVLIGIELRTNLAGETQIKLYKKEI